MKISPIISLGLSAVLGLGALFVGRVWLAGESEATETTVPVVETIVAAPIVTIPALVAREDIAPGTLVRPAMFRLREIADDALPSGAVEDFSDFSLNEEKLGYAIDFIPAGEPVVYEQVGPDAPRIMLSSMIQPGYRAMSIRVSAATGVGGFVLPGDRVDVTEFLELEPRNGDNGAKAVKAVPLIADVIVLGVDQQAAKNLEGAVVASTVTLEVTPQQSLLLGAAAQRSQLGLTLIGQDEVKADITPIKANPKPARAAPRTTAPPKPKAPTTATVRVINGDTVSTITAPVATPVTAEEAAQ